MRRLLLVLLPVLLTGCGRGPATSRLAVAVPAPAGAQRAAAACLGRGGLPDPRCTPGAITAAVTQANIARTVCVQGYTSRVRPPPSFTGPLKRRQMIAYGRAGGPADYEEDHLVPLSIGGAPDDPRNLWPEPRYGPQGTTADDKDAVELTIYQRVCSGRLSLAAAQQAMASDWRSATRLPDDRR